MENLSLFDKLIDVEERELSAIQGTLRCSCGNEHFRIYYFGKRTKGIFAPDIVRHKGIINIQAYCEVCEKSYGFDNYNQPQIQFNDQSKLTSGLLFYDNEKHKVRFSFNYFPEKFKSNNFEYLRVEIFQNNINKWRVIVEE